MKRILFSFAMVIFAIMACTPVMHQPVNSNEQPTTLSIRDYIPKPEDANLMRDVVYLDRVDLLILESFPVQFSLVLKGDLPTPCHELRISAEQPDAENKIVIDIYSVADPNTACVLVLEPFEANFPLGHYPRGHYSIWISGQQVDEFDAE